MQNIKSIGDLFLKKLQNLPYQTHIGKVEGERIKHYTTKSFYSIVEALHLSFSEISISSQSIVSILASTSLEWHLADMAILLNRSISVPIYPTYTSDEIEYILNHSESTVVFIENSHQLRKIHKVIDKLKDLKIIISFEEISSELKDAFSDFKIFTIDELINIGQNKQGLIEDSLVSSINSIEPQDIATIIYTSGTTGEPKGVVLTHEAVMTTLSNVKVFMQNRISSTDRSLTFLPLSHVLGRCDSFLPYILHNETIYAESFEKLADNIKTVKPTFMIAVPRVFEKIHSKVLNKIKGSSLVKEKLFDWAFNISKDYFRRIDKDLSPSSLLITQRQLAYNLVFSKIYEQMGGRIRFFVSGGAPISKEIMNFFRIANLPILEGYGLTETMGPILLNPLNKQFLGTVGLPIGDVKIKFSDDNEIMIHTKGMLTEYYKNDSESRKSITEDGWLLTGDIGKLNEYGYLEITDRKKDIIITSGGKNIAPQKIEGLMKLQPHINQFLTIGDKKKFLVGIVGIEREDFHEMLDELGLSHSCELAEIANHPKVIELIQSEIDSVNQSLAKFESIKKFYISPIEISLENGFLTPSLKLKKQEVFNKFNTQIDSMYRL